MYYGFEKDYASFEEFAVAIGEYIDYYNNKRIQKNKMDASCKIQRSIHDVRLTYKYVSRILGTYQTRAAIFVVYYYPCQRYIQDQSRLSRSSLLQ